MGYLKASLAVVAVTTVIVGLTVPGDLATEGVAYREGASLRQQAAGSPGQQLAEGYDQVFNDLELLQEKGPGAISRVPFNPRNGHKGLPPAHEPETALLRTRASLLAQGYVVEEGVFSFELLARHPNRARPGGSERPGETRIGLPSNIAMWHVDQQFEKGPKLFKNLSRANTSVPTKLAEFAERATAWVRKNPRSPYSSSVDGWTLYASPIPARHRKCLSCHTEAKVDDPIGIAAFAYRKVDP